MDLSLNAGLGRGRLAITGTTTVTGAHVGLTLDATSGTFAVNLTAAATIGGNFHAAVYNSGSGTITVTAAGAETIRTASGAANTLVLTQGQGAVFSCTGTGWDVIASSGLGAAAIVSTDNAVARFDGTAGQLQNSGVIIGDTNNVSGIVDLAVTGNVSQTGATTISTGTGAVSLNGPLALAPPASTGTPARDFVYTPAAHTALTASTEYNSIGFNSATLQFATGALSREVFMVIGAPTYAFVGASTITDAATLSITGAPVNGTNATITNSWALWLRNSGNLRMDGNFSQTGATTISTGTGAIALNGTTTIVAGKTLIVSDTTASTTTATGSITTAGGLGVAGKINSTTSKSFITATAFTESASLSAIDATFAIGNSAGSFRTLAFTTGSSRRITLNCDGTAESGSNAGSDFAVSTYDDTNGFIDFAFQIFRVAGGAVKVPRTTASTSTTTGALIVSGGVGVAGAIFAGSFNTAGNIAQTSTGTISTGTGAISLNGTVTIVSGKQLIVSDTTASTSTTTGAVTVAGGLGVVGQASAFSIQTGDGLVGTPSHSFIGDPDTGMYSTGANRLAFSTNGVLRLEIFTSQITPTVPIRGADGSISAPTYSFLNKINTGMAYGGSNDIYMICNGALSGRYETTRVVTDVALAVGPADVATGSPGYAFRISPAGHTALAASTEHFSFRMDTSSQQWAAGALTKQRYACLLGQTIRFASGSNTVSDAATFAIESAPIAGTNATITRSMSLWVQAGLSRFDGNVQIGNAYVATPQSPTGYIVIYDSTGTAYKVSCNV